VLYCLPAVVAASSRRVPLAWTAGEAAEALRVSPVTVCRLADDTDLRACRVPGRSIRIDDAGLRGYLAGHCAGRGGVTPQDIPAGHLRPEWQ
jgi:excisionase family DNA binding protein